MLKALALGGQGWLNVQADTVIGYAKSIWVSSDGHRHRLLSRTGSVILVDKLIRDAGVPEESPLRRSGPSVARAIDELRLAGVSHSEYEGVGESVEERQVATVFRLYQDYLEDRCMLDQADVLAAAVKILQEESFAARPRLVVIMDDLLLSELELKFVRLLSSSATSTFMISAHADGSDALARSAASLLKDWSIPESNTDTDRRGQSVHMIRAVGVENEIRAVFREIVGKGLPLDAIELAYATREPYVRAVESLSDRYGIDVTLSSGVDGTMTRVRQAIRLFLLWIGEGQSSARLVQMIRAGYVFLEDPEGVGTRLSFQAASLLARVHLTGGAETYHRFFKRHQRKLERELASARGTFVEDDRTRSLETAEIILDSLALLLSIGEVGTETTLDDLTGRIERFVKLYVLPEERTKIRPVDESIRDATEDLLSRFRRLSEEVQDRLPRSILLWRLLEFLDSQRFASVRSSSGSIRVVPLSQAGYSGRPHVYMVGLDELTMAPRSFRNPFLSDEFKGRIEEAHGLCIPASTDTSENRPRDLQKALRRAAAQVTFVYNCYDVADGRELYPSSVMLSLARSVNLEDNLNNNQNNRTPPLHSYIPNAEDKQIGLPLDWTDLVLAAKDTDETTEICDHRYPWIGRGRHAARQRALESWTPYDGQIHPGPSMKTPFSGNTRWSASRLETLSACPFRYFLKHVLKARILDEPEDEAWMTPLEKGLLVHRVLADFMSDRTGKITATDISQLEEQLLLEVDEFSRTRTPPNPAVEEGIKQEIKAIAGAFIHDELNRQDFSEPFAFEFGFGVWSHNKKAESDQTENVSIEVDGLRISLQGWIDRIDRLNSGGFAITDYKTGSSSRYDANDLLAGGRSMQWALYAYVVEDLLSEPVHLSGYLFPGGREFGRRVEANPNLARQAVGEELRRVGRLVKGGAFFQAANEQGECKFCDYKRVCGDVTLVKSSIRIKIEATDGAMANYDLLSDWNYAAKFLPKQS
ncbi:MAG: PD-(D/E)XK nuclease family protein [Rhodothermia bacterium]|nr:MAG: PD-(D/E)XK nuclease family protein [Rhodothermia bacterium]